jgi:hypothetical protein
LRKLSLSLLLALSTSCADGSKRSAAHAALDVAHVSDLVGKDVAEIERGLPQGAKQMAPLVGDTADPRDDIPAVRRALLHIRRDVPDLNVGKSTFFALADAHGVAIRNDLEEDTMAGQNLFDMFPELRKARGGLATTTGVFHNSNSPVAPLDKDWIAAMPILKEDTSIGAFLVTGWSYRFFARHLQEALKTRLLDEAKAAGNEGRLPVFYVAVFDSSGVYGSPVTPRVDEQALADQNLFAKTSGGLAQGTLTIADRAFGFAAQRTPRLGPDLGVVVLRTEF